MEWVSPSPQDRKHHRKVEILKTTKSQKSGPTVFASPFVWGGGRFWAHCGFLRIFFAHGPMSGKFVPKEPRRVHKC